MAKTALEAQGYEQYYNKEVFEMTAE